MTLADLAPTLGAGTVWRPEHTTQLRAAARVAEEWLAGRPAEGLASVLYERWYAPTVPIPALDPLLPPLAGVLRQAHAAAESWLDAAVLRVGAGGLVLVARPGEPPRAVVRGDVTHPSTSSRLGLRPVPGEAVRVRERRDAPPAEGWWRTWGPGWNLLEPPPGLTRLYLAPDPHRVTALVRALTTVTRSLADPWMLKVTEDRSALARPDGVVLYVAQDLVTVRDAGLAGALVDATAGLLRDAAPALTLALAPGLAAAEDPGDGRSFGQLCSAVVADGLTAAGPEDALARITRAFVAAGVDPAHPYLRPASRGEEPS